MPLNYLFLLFLVPTLLCGQDSLRKEASEAMNSANEAMYAAERAVDLANVNSPSFSSHAYASYNQYKAEVRAEQKRYQEKKLLPGETLEDLAAKILRLSKTLRIKRIATNIKGIPLAQYLAVRSIREDDVNIQGLLAKEAYDINLIHPKNPYDYLIYEALYKSAKRLEETKNKQTDFNIINKLPKDYRRIGRFRHIKIDDVDKKIYTIGSCGSLLKWDLDANQKETTQTPEVFFNDFAVSRALDKSPDGKYLAIAGDSSKILIFEAKNGKLVKELAYIGDRIFALKYTPNGKGIITIEDISFKSHTRQMAVCYTNLSNSYAHIIKKIPSRFRSVEISKDGQYLVCVGRTAEIVLWNLQDECSELFLKHPRNSKNVTAAAFDPSGRFLVVGHQDGRLLIWDLKQVKQNLAYYPYQLLNHQAKISDIEFSPDGSLFVVGSLDQTATLWRLWDKAHFGAENNQESPYLAPWYSPILLEDHDDWVTAVGFSHNGTKVVTGTANGKLKLWEVDMTVYAHQVCSLIDPANKVLSYSTWIRYIDSDDVLSEDESYLEYFTRRNKERCP
jgi:WD40 repeat protein